MTAELDARQGTKSLQGGMIPEPTLSTKVSRRALALALKMLGRLDLLKAVDLAVVATDNTEGLLNLKSAQRFFPTEATSTERVSKFVRKLHPVRCGKELIRLGPNGDGGYLVPDDLEGIVACFSPGVSDVAGFERDCASRGMNVFMADASVDAPPERHERFEFIKKFVGSASQGDTISFEEWVSSRSENGAGDLLLQMDIEGGEYETLLSTPMEIQSRFRIIVVEFHHLYGLFSEPLFVLYSKAFEKLLSTHACVHIHPNNVCRPLRVGELEIPQLAEFTFLRRDRLGETSFASVFPHPSDFDCVPEAPQVLPRSLYGG